VGVVVVACWTVPVVSLSTGCTQRKRKALVNTKTNRPKRNDTE